MIPGPRIVVCLRFGIDVAELRADASGAPRLARAPRRLDPFSECAVEAAVRLVEAGGGGLRVLSAVEAEPPRELQLRVLAMGADELVLVQDEGLEWADAGAVAALLAAGLRAMQPWDLLICGEAAADRYERQTGPRLAEALDLPMIGRATHLELLEGLVRATRSLEDRCEDVEAFLPALVTVGAEIGEPRLPALLQILGAGSRPTTRWAANALGISTGASQTERLSTLAPPGRRRRERLGDGGAAGLVRWLDAEGLLERG